MVRERILPDFNRFTFAETSCHVVHSGDAPCAEEHCCWAESTLGLQSSSRPLFPSDLLSCCFIRHWKQAIESWQSPVIIVELSISPFICLVCFTHCGTLLWDAYTLQRLYLLDGFACYHYKTPFSVSCNHICPEASFASYGRVTLTSVYRLVHLVHPFMGGLRIKSNTDSLASGGLPGNHRTGQIMTSFWGHCFESTRFHSDLSSGAGLLVFTMNLGCQFSRLLQSWRVGHGPRAN